MMITKKLIRKGLLLFVAACYILYFIRVIIEFRKCTQPVTATYAGVGPGLGKSFGHTLLFSYQYNGKLYEAGESMTSQNIFSFRRDKMDRKMEKLGYVIGQQYTIRVNPNQPEKFISDTRSTYGSLALGLFLILGLIVIEWLDR